MIRDILITLWTRFRRRQARHDFWLKADEPQAGWARWIIAAATAVVLTALFPHGQSLQFADLATGSVSNRRVVAPFDFEILKTDDQVSIERAQATRDILPVFFRDPAASGLVLKRLDGLIETVRRARQAAAARPGRLELLADSLQKGLPVPGLRQEHWRSLIRKEADFERFASVLRRSIRESGDAGILNLGKKEFLPDGGTVLIGEGAAERAVPGKWVFDPEEAARRAAEAAAGAFPAEPDFFNAAAMLAQWLIVPSLNADVEGFRSRIRSAVARVPLSSGFVFENEKIVDRNERITPDIRQKLVSLSAKMTERGLRESGLRRFLPVAGKAAFVLSLLFLFAVVVHFDEPELLGRTKSVFLLCFVTVLVALAAALMHHAEASEFLVPVSAGSMLIAAMFDARIGFAASALISVLAGGLWGNAYVLTAVSFFVGVVGVIVIKRVRSRSQLIQAVLIMTGAHVFAVTFMGLLGYLPPREILSEWRFAAINGLFSPIVVYGLLALFESTFDIATDFSLLELSNLNHPLLKQLSVEAPGTYHHSILVGNLAEAAAQAVNANSLLARVGSYYHDIGKIDKSEYFVENQLGAKNPHRKLAPRMSALILSNHVKQSLELAEQYRLPSAIQAIMSEHHGRSVMQFFYQKALAQKARDEDVNEEDYRYPGPKPQTKESAIVMLADAVEAASRTLKQATHSRLKGLIESLVDERFKAGELDESPVTLRDLERIKEAFLNILEGTFHARVQYPDRETPAKPQIETRRETNERPDPKEPEGPVSPVG
jgi:putative nucleotidyltransferase with HDIG domain